MEFIDISTERTTAVTDVFLAVIAIVANTYLHHISEEKYWKVTLWRWFFCLMAFASILGTIAHGLKISHVFQTFLWYPLYLSLGLLLGVFTTAVLYDFYGEAIARRAFPIMIAISLFFFCFTVFWSDSFLVFIIYEAMIMFFALVGYICVAYRGYPEGAWLMAFGIFITIIAGVVQASNNISFTFIWSFDHNGVYHLVQMLGVVLLMAGLRKAFISRVHFSK